MKQNGEWFLYDVWTHKNPNHTQKKIFFHWWRLPKTAFLYLNRYMDRPGGAQINFLGKSAKRLFHYAEKECIFRKKIEIGAQGKKCQNGNLAKKEPDFFLPDLDSHRSRHHKKSTPHVFRGVLHIPCGQKLSVFDHVCIRVDNFHTLNMGKNQQFSDHVCILYVLLSTQFVNDPSRGCSKATKSSFH